MLDWDESFSMQANVTSSGPQRIALRGYVTERRPDGLYAAPLLPQLFYGADGTQLTSWRQYISGTGSQTILSRSGGQPSIPKEELYWRRVGNTVSAPVGMYSVGQRIPGSLQPLSQVTLSTGETEKGKYYELHIDTDGITDPSKAVEALIVGLRNHGVETVWASADARRINIQIAGSPMAWAALIPLVPTILSVLGIVVTLVAVYVIFGGVPGWAFGLLAIGILFLTIVPTLIKLPDRRY
ncbi:hypothetical protein KKF82_04975 [Patescibacteria group bacterium]|nr:hypothetical protein [Patescibacteria group bacterium]